MGTEGNCCQLKRLLPSIAESESAERDIFASTLALGDTARAGGTDPNLFVQQQQNRQHIIWDNQTNYHVSVK